MASLSSSVASRVQLRTRGPASQPGPQLKAAQLARPSFSRRGARPSAHGPQPVLAAALAEEEDVVTDDAEMDVKSLYAEFAELLDQYDHNFKRGDMVTGTIFKVDSRGAYVDIGAKSPGYCNSMECSLSPKAKANDVLTVGTQREFLIVKDNARDGEIALSLKKMEQTLAWERIRQLLDENVTLQAKILSINRGGMLVETENIKGFVPTSHVTQQFSGEQGLGKTMNVKILEVDEERERLVLSNRRAEVTVMEKDFKVGDVIEGSVSSVTGYGAFINLGSVNGLLHISQISHEMVTSVESVLSPGDKIKVMVLTKDMQSGRVALSTRKLEPNPGDMLRDPALVYAKADEMAATFRERVAAAEAAAREEEQRLESSIEEAAEEIEAPKET